jgi:hypothetical protein
MGIFYPANNNSTELSLSWEATNSLVSQEITNILWNQMIYYRVHKSPHSPYPEPDESVHTVHPISPWSTLILYSHLG